MEGTHNIPLLENKLKICIQHNSPGLQQRSPFTIHIQGDDRDHGADILICLEKREYKLEHWHWNWNILG